MDPNDRFIPADEVASQMGTGVDPANNALLQALTQIRQTQARPLIADNPFAQLGSGLEGLAAGFRGQVNPAVQQALAVRQQQLSALGAQANLGLGISHLQMQMNDAALRQRMEDRRVRQEQQTEEQRRATEVFKTRGTMVNGMLGLAKDNPLLAAPAMREMEAMYRQANIPVPPGGFNIEGMRDLATQSKKVGTALIAYPGLSDATIASSTGVTVEAVTQMRTTLATPGPEKDALTKSLWNWTADELAADKDKLQKAKLELNKAKLDAVVNTRLFQLGQKQTLSPAEQAERFTLEGFGKMPNEERDLVRVYMEQQNLPLDLAIPKAARTISEAKNQSDFKDVVRAIRQKNPQMSEGEAVLAANAQVKASKSDFSALETQVDTMKDFVARLKEYSSQVNVSATGVAQGAKGLVRYGMSYVRPDEALAGLQRKQGELANVMRFLGEKGVISDRDITRGMLLLPSIWTSGPIARDSLRELEDIIKRAETNLARRRASATQIGGPPPAAPPQRGDPVGIR